MSEPDLRAILEQTRTIAVLGAHWEPQRAACYVPEYLASVGYRVLPVNPIGAGRSGFGAPFVGSLAELTWAVDMVDVFRRAELLPAHEAEILAMTPRPAVVWLQLGIRNDAFADRLRTAGITVVQDRCTLAEHRRLGLPPHGRA
ncbi:MAG: CoA-binding protein [Deltaproteobacteria bacterium]|nr:CoA-binding protein [Deltaproteobacteria bacterium]MBK8720613.1 CoA-binding protein [Deltaproteobacteria bacterium]MBP7289369.1 CoA-binding protein [Nannocystaceae bacterium]